MSNNAALKITSDLDYIITGKGKYVSQKNYKEEMLDKVEPYIKKNLKSGYIIGENNLKLYYEKFMVKNPKANIVICHGFGEFTEKYYELIYYLMKENYSVFIMEHRGHGRSPRLGIDSSQISVEKFDYYTEDFKRFIDEIVIPNSSNKNLFLFAHSMGGGIGTLFLEQYTNYFTAAVLSSPMHEINTGKAPKIFANIVSRSLRILGRGINYLPGQVPYAKKKASPTRSTSCKERYEYLHEKIKKHDEYQCGGSSALWYIEGVKATRKLIKKENASKVKIPVLLLQAEYDTHVIPEAQKKFAQYATNCELVKVDGSKHESYYERDEIAFSVFDKIISFYTKNV
ncbi:alpha/beta fold hydrolase [Clostridium chromiireducens]|uniref:Alpha/beta hydrolase n=1 Tax=Clostridium chromiireducens TaxID=225345 RepID=A0A1V4IFW0_9CLOT|nr:alpha/beta hydrolase [Clostridium chromiireducens]OPJ58545.1 lysophospholipase L2 [Clostridium chromiireducens]RII36034.1 alpha/beta hydrolase [Clostridium chromiireducens]